VKIVSFAKMLMLVCIINVYFFHNFKPNKQSIIVERN